MPTYDYACAKCGGFEAIRPLADRNHPAACPNCRGEAGRVFVAAPRLGLMEAGTRAAMATNERARHEPKSSRDYVRLKHPAGLRLLLDGKARHHTYRRQRQQGVSKQAAVDDQPLKTVDGFTGSMVGRGPIAVVVRAGV